jgi:hypothetical protein
MDGIRSFAFGMFCRLVEATDRPNKWPWKKLPPAATVLRDERAAREMIQHFHCVKVALLTMSDEPQATPVTEQPEQDKGKNVRQKKEDVPIEELYDLSKPIPKVSTCTVAVILVARPSYWLTTIFVYLP